MARVGVDISVFTKDHSFGRISGSIDVAVIPHIGDSVSFIFPKEGNPLVGVRDFPGLIKVVERVISAGGDEKVLLSLEDVTVETSDDARKVMTFFEESYGLIGDVHGADG